MKTAELEGEALDLWVAWALGWHQEGGFWYGPTDLTGRVTRDDNPIQEEVARFHPTRFWAQGGPIIEREGIELQVNWVDYSGIARNGRTREGGWHAEMEHSARADGVQRSSALGGTPLIAAMRAYVASKFGDEVAD